VSRKCARRSTRRKIEPCQWRPTHGSVSRRVHRFNRAQQDILLPDVENGLIILIGATTENPFLRRQCAAGQPQPDLPVRAVSEEDITALIHRAINDKERGFGNLKIDIAAEAVQLWATKSDGDARRALTAL